MKNVGQSSIIPFSVACIGIATFAGMDAFMKGLSIELGVYNAMLWRTSIALLMAATLFVVGRKSWPSNSSIRVHVWRGIITSVMAFLFFWGLIYIPLAEAIALSFIAPLIALYLAAVLLKESIGGKAIWASVIGLSGAVVIVAGKLSGEYDDSVGKGIAAILVSAVLYAYNLILQRQQALIAEPIEIAFFQNATVVMIYWCLAPFLAVVPSMSVVPELVVTAFLGIISTLMLSWAYARAEAKILIPVEYTAFIWAVILGWVMFAEQLSWQTLSGTALIVIGCLVASKQKNNHVDHIETTAI
jgi:S-adenosylmethionine uptake transporter